MNVVINALQVLPGHAGGTETYIFELVKALGNVNRVNRYTILVWRESEDWAQSFVKNDILKIG